MKNPFKHRHTPKDQPPQEHQPSLPYTSHNLTGADLEHIQGGRGLNARVEITFYVEPISFRYNEEG